MNSHDAIRTTAETSAMVLESYFSDLDDSELFLRPGEGCNHLAYQLGHLISSECQLLEMIAPGAACELPTGFTDQYSKEMVGEDDPTKFHTKDVYLKLLGKTKDATLAALEKTTDADLDAAGPEHFRQMFPTVGHIYVLLATHRMMHAGQFVPVRRKLSKPIVI